MRSDELGSGFFETPLGLASAGITAMHGAAAARSGEAIVVGAAVGAVIGLGVGANDAVEEHHQEISDCLREKGYEVVAAAAPSAPR